MANKFDLICFDEMKVQWFKVRSKTV